MRYYIFLLICGLLVACSKEQKAPPDVLPPQKMQAILWELMKADEVVNHYAADPAKNRYAISIDLYNKAFIKGGTTKEVFKKSIDWYSSHPQVLKPVLDSLQRQHKTTGG